MTDSSHADRLDRLQKHVHEALALEQHLLHLVERHHGDETLAATRQLSSLVDEVERMLQRHCTILENYLDGIGGLSASRLRRTLSGFSGALAGLYERLREPRASRFLRDTYTALSLTAITYAMLHTTGLAHREARLAHIAIAHLQDLTAVLEEIGHLVPHVLARELADDEGADGTVGAEAERTTRRARSPHSMSEWE